MPEGVTTLAPITYLVAMPEPASHEFDVEMRVPALRGRDSVELVFPTWAPGSYLVLSHATGDASLFAALIRVCMTS